MTFFQIGPHLLSFALHSGFKYSYCSSVSLGAWLLEGCLSGSSLLVSSLLVSSLPLSLTSYYFLSCFVSRLSSGLDDAPAQPMI